MPDLPAIFIFKYSEVAKFWKFYGVDVSGLRYKSENDTPYVWTRKIGGNMQMNLPRTPFVERWGILLGEEENLRRKVQDANMAKCDNFE